eukprot:CAMPEP_0195079822 /NCGR_PEP_ID=MMETSP0448-20130528/21672_1 /TAXON_ID=66468 /ORGANISM="Heterocapsa triquestra, Strain CCMP 448" /LENGTH=36 /DNA_ID= /DNA_START= /DNA_END= /DNA_ORIENTATION=
MSCVGKGDQNGRPREERGGLRLQASTRDEAQGLGQE